MLLERKGHESSSEVQAVRSDGRACRSLSDNLAKTETAIEAMPHGDGKLVAQKEIASAQDSLLNGKMGTCGTHLNKVMHATMGK